MREHPIIFTGESVRAILDGRKTQTRRMMNPQPEEVSGAAWVGREDGLWAQCRDELMRGCMDAVAPPIRCPYGVPGDRLWVRESGWYHIERYEADEDDPDCGAEFFRWRESPREGKRRWLPPLEPRVDAITFLAASTPLDHAPAGEPRSPYGMPRWASRLLLEATEVRVQRLRSISTSDVDAEGIDYETSEDWHEGERLQGAGSPMSPERYAFACGWNRINGKRADWESNPWVWAITFRVAS